jgi:hypothetical protein
MNKKKNQNKSVQAALTIYLIWAYVSRRFLWEFPIGSYVKLSSAVAAILVRGLKCRLDGPLPNMCPVIPTSNQNGHQAKNRKKEG